jgi:putative ABC transport system substrate-binding protein
MKRRELISLIGGAAPAHDGSATSAAALARREFISLIGGAAVSSATWPLWARAQQAALPTIGYLSTRASNEDTHLVAAFRQGLAESGYAEGRNLAIDYRWAEGKYDRLPEMAADLVRRRVAVIATPGLPPALAAKAATSTIPIVFGSGDDAVKNGLVASLNRPGGNVTGVSLLAFALGPKMVEMLRELAPNAAVIHMLVNPNNPNVEVEMKEVQATAASHGLRLQAQKAGTPLDIDAAFSNIALQPSSALLVANDAFLTSRRSQTVALAARYGIPAVYPWREYTAIGGLMSYGSSLPDSYRQIGIYVARILNGAKPADLPVMQPTKFELVINLKTVKALGLTVPDKLLVAADEVIE